MILTSRRLLTVAAVALGAIYVVWLTAAVVPGDYATKFAPPMNALLGGHVAGFFASLPTDGAGGSVPLQAPAALIGKLVGGGQLASFRFAALECVLVAAVLGLWLARGMRGADRPRVAQATVISLCVLVPGILGALLFGHPEEIFGAAFCVGGVLLAGEDHETLAGIALGLAVINKPWALFAVAPVLLAARPGKRLALLGFAGGVVASWLGAARLIAPAQFSQQLSGAVAVVAHPVDIWWPLAHPAVTPGGTHLYLAPGFLAHYGRQLSLLVAIPLAVPLARRRERSVDGCLALLALLLLLRCLLDPSNHVYYQVPFVIALVAWDARANRTPALALLATGSLWLVFHTISGIAGVNVQFAAYLAVTLPFVAVLLGPAFGRPPLRARAVLARGRPGRAARPRATAH